MDNIIAVSVLYLTLIALVVIAISVSFCIYFISKKELSIFESSAMVTLVLGGFFGKSYFELIKPYQISYDIAGYTTVLGAIFATIAIIEMTSFIAAKKTRLG